MGFLDLIAGIFKPAAELIDELHTSEEEKLKQQRRLLEIQAMVLDSSLQYEKEMMTSRAEIINSEAKSEHWITATWRPITMLTFLALAVGDSLGLLQTPLRDEAWTLLQLGISGYIFSRGAEKVIKEVRRE